jgi:hypothetical protein
MKAVSTVLAAALLVTLVAVPVRADMRPLSLEQLKHSIGMGDMPIWGDVAAEIHAAMDDKGLVLAEQVFAGNAMKKMVPEADRVKILTFMPRHRIEVTVVLMAIGSWKQGKLPELLERDPSTWWAPGDGKGFCACEVLVDGDCCTMASTCAWQDGRCGCT